MRAEDLRNELVERGLDLPTSEVVVPQCVLFFLFESINVAGGPKFEEKYESMRPRACSKFEEGLIKLSPLLFVEDRNAMGQGLCHFFWLEVGYSLHL